MVHAAAAQPRSPGVSGLDRALAALADPTRRGVVELLRRRPRRAGELASEFGLSPPAMSRHLRVLRSTGLVEEEHGGEDDRARVYRLRQQPIGELRHWLDVVEAFWTLQLDGFKAHAEKRARRR